MYRYSYSAVINFLTARTCTRSVIGLFTTKWAIIILHLSRNYALYLRYHPQERTFHRPLSCDIKDHMKINLMKYI